MPRGSLQWEKQPQIMKNWNLFLFVCLVRFGDVGPRPPTTMNGWWICRPQQLQLLTNQCEQTQNTEHRTQNTENKTQNTEPMSKQRTEKGIQKKQQAIIQQMIQVAKQLDKPKNIPLYKFLSVFYFCGCCCQYSEWTGVSNCPSLSRPIFWKCTTHTNTHTHKTKHTHTNTHTQNKTHTHTHTHTQNKTHRQIHTHTKQNTHTQIHTHKTKHTHTHTHTHKTKHTDKYTHTQNTVNHTHTN